MRRVAEIMHVVESQREEFLNGVLHPDEETKRVLWLCGVRRQLYFELNDLIFMTFGYDGNNFEDDMKKMAIYLDSKGFLIQKRRRDVPVEERGTTNWWAPVKKLGTVLETKPDFEEAQGQAEYMAMLDGGMGEPDGIYDIAYDEEDWL